MNNINQISTLELSTWINLIRRILLQKKFFEHHLYSTNNYKIENTETFKLENKFYLRYNPEPEIWSVGDLYNKFFWIGSLFRKERKSTPIHKKEFSVVDIYIKDSNRENVVSLFFKILRIIEKKFDLVPLSNLPIKYIKYSEFKKQNSPNKKYWLVVTDYLIGESFYDEADNLANETTKFEIYFADGYNFIELAVGGKLGKNLNKKKLIKNENKFVNKRLFDKNFIGFGFGIERLIYTYKTNSSSNASK